MDFSTLLVLELACLAAFFLKGFSGFGPALVFIPVVSVLCGPRTAIVASAFLDLCVGAVMVLSLKYDRADFRIVLRMALCLAVGSVAGAGLVGVVPPRLLLTFIGIMVFVLGLQLLARRQFAPAPVGSRGSTLLWIGCLGGGFTGGLVGISGPPVVAAARARMDKAEFRRRLAALFLVGAAVRLSVYVGTGLWDAAVLEISVWAAPAVVVGLLLGYRWHRTTSERGFSLVVGAVLLILAARVLFSALRGAP